MSFKLKSLVLFIKIALISSEKGVMTYLNDEKRLHLQQAKCKKIWSSCVTMIF